MYSFCVIMQSDSFGYLSPIFLLSSINVQLAFSVSMCFGKSPGLGIRKPEFTSSLFWVTALLCDFGQVPYLLWTLIFSSRIYNTY